MQQQQYFRFTDLRPKVKLIKRTTEILRLHQLQANIDTKSASCSIFQLIKFFNRLHTLLGPQFVFFRSLYFPQVGSGDQMRKLKKH